MRYIRQIISVSAVAVMLGFTGAAHAQAGYPDKTIKILVGYPAGGGVDIVARAVADSLKGPLGQPVIVENRAGAAATIAANAVAKSPADGYTFLMAAAGEVAVNQYLAKDRMTYDAQKDLMPIVLGGIVPCVIVVDPKLPINNAAELVSYARANKGKLSFSSSGNGNPQHLAGELFNRMAGTDILHVPYRGSAPAVMDVATGSVSMSFSSLGAALPLMQDNKVRAVAVTSKQGMPQLPNVKPVASVDGLADYELLNWFGMFAPTGLPPAIAERIANLVEAALKNPAVASKLEAQGIVPRPIKLAEFKTFVDAENAKFAKVIKDADIKGD